MRQMRGRMFAGNCEDHTTWGEFKIDEFTQTSVRKFSSGLVAFAPTIPSTTPGHESREQ